MCARYPQARRAYQPVQAPSPPTYTNCAHAELLVLIFPHAHKMHRKNRNTTYKFQRKETIQNHSGNQDSCMQIREACDRAEKPNQTNHLKTSQPEHFVTLEIFS